MSLNLARKDKRKVLYIRVISGIPSVIFRKKISPNATQTGLKGKPFPFNPNRPAYRIKNIFYYFVDVERGQLFLYDEKEKISPELRNTITKEVAKQLVSGLESTPLFQNIGLILLLIGFGGAVGYIIGSIFPIA